MLRKILSVAVLIACVMTAVPAEMAQAVPASNIDLGVDNTLKFFSATKGADSIIKSAKGVLVFPAVFKAGIGLGGEYGEGALRINGKTVEYYSTAAASIGFQLGAQKKSIIIAFMDQSALDTFRASSGWKIGADASVAVIAVGAGGAIDTAITSKPIVAFVFDQKGLMYNVTLEGAKITKIFRK